MIYHETSNQVIHLFINIHHPTTINPRYETRIREIRVVGHALLGRLKVHNPMQNRKRAKAEKTKRQEIQSPEILPVF